MAPHSTFSYLGRSVTPSKQMAGVVHASSRGGGAYEARESFEFFLLSIMCIFTFTCRWYRKEQLVGMSVPACSLPSYVILAGLQVNLKVKKKLEKKKKGKGGARKSKGGKKARAF